MLLIRATSVEWDLGGIRSEDMEIAHIDNFEMFDSKDEEEK